MNPHAVILLCWSKLNPGQKTLQEDMQAAAAEIERLEKAVADDAMNCPSCGRHDFGLLSGYVRRIRDLEAEIKQVREHAEAQTLQAEKQSLFALDEKTKRESLESELAKAELANEALKL